MSELSDSFHVGGEMSVVFDYRDTYASGVASDTIAKVRHGDQSWQANTSADRPHLRWD